MKTLDLTKILAGAVQKGHICIQLYMVMLRLTALKRMLNML